MSVESLVTFSAISQSILMGKSSRKSSKVGEGIEGNLEYISWLIDLRDLGDQMSLKPICSQEAISTDRVVLHVQIPGSRVVHDKALLDTGHGEEKPHSHHNDSWASKRADL